MNKEQLIEEMAKCKVCYQRFGKCPLENKSPCTDYTNAENMYERGYRKVPDGAVILTPEERDEELKACNEKQAELENEIYALKTNYDCLSEHCTDLENKNVAAENMIDSQAKEIERLKGDNKALEMWNEALTEENEKLKIYNDKLCQGIYWGNGENFSISIEKAKQNAVKEFAEKLKMKAFDKDMFNDWAGATYVVLVREIDKLLKEWLK